MMYYIVHYQYKTEDAEYQNKFKAFKLLKEAKDFLKNIRCYRCMVSKKRKKFFGKCNCPPHKLVGIKERSISKHGTFSPVVLTD